MASSLPLGWRLQNDQPVSLRGSLSGEGWKTASGDLKPMRCSRSGHLALMVGAQVALTVEPVPPAKEIEWTNPDGDGEYEVTVTNTSDQTIRVPALLQDGQRIPCDESLVIVCQSKSHPLPGARGVTSPIEAAELSPRQSVSVVVNALRLEGPEWP